MLPENIKVLIDLGIGDGSITKSSAGNCSFTIAHGMKQAEYAHHKADLLRYYGFVVSESTYTASTGKNKGKSFYRVFAHTNPVIKTAYKWLYNKGKKTVDNSFLKYADGRTLAYWFMDDGAAKTVQWSKKPHGKYIYEFRKVLSYVLSTDCFTHHECTLVVHWLKNKFDINAKLGNYGGNYRVMINSIPDKDKFRSVVEPYIIDNLRYKISYPHAFSGMSFRFVPFEVSAAEETERERLEI